MMLAVIICLLSGLAEAADIPFRNRSADAGLPGEWLSSFSASARDAGLANASTALSGPPAAYVNPAGIAASLAGEINFMVAPLFSSGQFQTLSAAYPLSFDRSLGATFVHLGSGEAEKTDALGQSLGSFNEQNFAFMLSYGQAVSDGLNLGVAVKTVTQSIAEFSGTGYGADLGLQSRFSESLTMGLALQNILAPKIKLREETDRFPLVARIGFACDFSVLGPPFLLSVDMSVLNFAGGGNVVRKGVGLEWQPLPAVLPFFLRFGINQREYTAGFGIVNGQITFDYAAVFHELEILHRLGITLRYNAFSSLEDDKYTGELQKIRMRIAELKRVKNQVREDNVKLKPLWQEVKQRLDEGSDAESLKILQRILDISPDDAKARAVMAQVRDRQIRTEALTQFAKAKEFYTSRHYRASREILEKFMPLLEEYSEARSLALMSSAQVFLEEGNYREAQKSLLKAVELNPDNREAALLYDRVKDIIGTSETDRE